MRKIIPFVLAFVIGTGAFASSTSKDKCDQLLLFEVEPRFSKELASEMVRLDELTDSTRNFVVETYSVKPATPAIRKEILENYHAIEDGDFISIRMRKWQATRLAEQGWFKYIQFEFERFDRNFFPIHRPQFQTRNLLEGYFGTTIAFLHPVLSRIPGFSHVTFKGTHMDIYGSPSFVSRVGTVLDRGEILAASYQLHVQEEVSFNQDQLIAVLNKASRVEKHVRYPQHLLEPTTSGVADPLVLFGEEQFSVAINVFVVAADSGWERSFDFSSENDTWLSGVIERLESKVSEINRDLLKREGVAPQSDEAAYHVYDQLKIKVYTDAVTGEPFGALGVGLSNQGDITYEQGAVLVYFDSKGQVVRYDEHDIKSVPAW